jgi:tRNA A37 N6-isopentenylltransferase MiaA
MRTVHYICGPTSSGKTALAAAVARRYPRVVLVNADSMQCFDGLRPLAAHPTPDEIDGIRQRLFGVLPLLTTFTNGDWLRMAAREIGALGDADLPMLVGGSRGIADALLGAAHGWSLPFDRCSLPSMADDVGTGLPDLSWRVRVVALVPRPADLAAAIRQRVDRARDAIVEAVGEAAALGLDDQHTLSMTFGYLEIRDALRSGGDLDAAFDALTAKCVAYAADQAAMFGRLLHMMALERPDDLLVLEGQTKASWVDEVVGFVEGGGTVARKRPWRAGATSRNRDVRAVFAIRGQEPPAMVRHRKRKDASDGGRS